ncbi:MAG: hypothetical protein K1X81_14170 [Bacteroidia bacterium]|nr:hypothetical protein [Bacteroidia bacterium]
MKFSFFFFFLLIIFKLQAQNKFSAGLTFGPALNFTCITNSDFDRLHFSTSASSLGYIAGVSFKISMFNYKMETKNQMETGFYLNYQSSSISFDKTDYQYSEVNFTNKISYPNFQIPVIITHKVKFNNKWRTQDLKIGIAYNLVQLGTENIRGYLNPGDTGYINFKFIESNIPLKKKYMSLCAGIGQNFILKNNSVIELGVLCFYDLSSFTQRGMYFDLDKNGVITSYQTTMRPKFINLNFRISYYPFHIKKKITHQNNSL